MAGLEEVKPPTERRYLTNDSTIEKLGELLNENPNGLLVYRDELSGLFAAMERDGHEQDRPFYLEGWKGTGSFTYDRIGRGTVRIKAMCLSMLGSIQPEPLRANLGRSFKDGANDGFIQRFQLSVFPDTPSTWQNIDRKPNAEARARAFKVFETLDTLDVSKLGATIGEPLHEEKVPYLHFAPDAQQFFDEWHATLERRLRSDDEHPVMIEHLSKYRSLMPSLALIFHLAEGGNGLVRLP
jgi:putative DNA primase/helicase